MSIVFWQINHKLIACFLQTPVIIYRKVFASRLTEITFLLMKNELCMYICILIYFKKMTKTNDFSRKYLFNAQSYRVVFFYMNERAVDLIA